MGLTVMTIIIRYRNYYFVHCQRTQQFPRLALTSLKHGLHLSKKLQKLKVSKYSVASHRLRNYRFLRVETLNLRGDWERDNL